MEGYFLVFSVAHERAQSLKFFSMDGNLMCLLSHLCLAHSRCPRPLSNTAWSNASLLHWCLAPIDFPQCSCSGLSASFNVASSLRPGSFFLLTLQTLLPEKDNYMPQTRRRRSFPLTSFSKSLLSWPLACLLSPLLCLQSIVPSALIVLPLCFASFGETPPAQVLCAPPLCCYYLVRRWSQVDSLSLASLPTTSSKLHFPPKTCNP